MLCSLEKDSYVRRASRLGMTGHNLFISRYMRQHLRTQSKEAIADTTDHHILFFPVSAASIHVLLHSVSGSMEVSRSPYTAFEPVSCPDGS